MADWFCSNEHEEQESEMEALSSIFMDDFEDLTPARDGTRQFKLHLTPSLEDDEKVFVSLDLFVSYTRNYPNILPHFRIENVVGLDDDDEYTKELHTQIHEKVGIQRVNRAAKANFSSQQAKQFEGEPMVFELSVIIRDLLASLNEAPKSLFEQRDERQKTKIAKQVESDAPVDVGSPNSEENVLEDNQLTPFSRRRMRTASTIAVRWKIEKFYRNGRYGSLFHASNLSHPDHKMIVKEIPLPIPVLVPAGQKSNVKHEFITKRIKQLLAIKHKYLASYLGAEISSKGYKKIHILREFIEGESLCEWIQHSQTKTRDSLRLASIAKPILIALQHLHSFQFAHEQLHTQNVIIEKKSGFVFLTDFSVEQAFLRAHNQDVEFSFHSMRRDIWDLGALLIDIATMGEIHVYDKTSVRDVAIPFSLDSIVIDFIHQCFDDKRCAIELLLDSPFILAVAGINNSAMTTPLFSSCEMPLDSDSRYEADFEQMDVLGRGGFGEVVRARNRLDGRMYAIKRISLGDDMSENKELLKEVTTLAILQHEYVVRYYQAWIELKSTDDFGLSDDDSELEFCPYNEEEDDEDGNGYSRDDSKYDDLRGSMQRTFSYDASSDLSGVSFCEDSTESLGFETGSAILYIQMEFCTNNTLSDLIQENRLSNHSENVWRLFREILEGLHYVHQQGLIHRDLKPANIFIDKDNNVKIGDFGLATASTSTDHGLLPLGSSVDLDSDDYIVGTAFYCPPENTRTISPKADMFSLGIILLEMCIYFSTGSERHETVKAARAGKLPDSFILSHPAQAEIILQLLSKNPKNRPSTIELLQSELIPKQFGDETLLESLRSITTPRTTIFSTLMQRLFSLPSDSHMNVHYTRSITRNMSNTNSDPIRETLRKNFVEIFHKRGARRFDTPLCIPKPPDINLPSKVAFFMNEAGTIVMLPFDLTLSFASYIAFHRNTCVFPMKRYSFGQVYRDVDGSHPRGREEMDLDIIRGPTDDLLLSQTDLLYDIQLLMHYIESQVAGKVQIYINHADIFRAILDACEIEEDDILSVSEVLETRLKSSWAHLAQILKTKSILITNPLKLEEYTNIRGELKSLSKILPEEITIMQPVIKAMTQLRLLAKYLATFRLCKKSIPITFCSGVVHNLSSRDHLMIMVTIETAGKVSVIGAGGSYRKLISQFLSPSDSSIAPPISVGIGFSLDTIVNIIMSEQKDAMEVESSQVKAIVFSDSLEERMKVTAVLWAADIYADYIYHTNAKQDDLLTMCLSRNIKWLILPRKKDRVVIKDTVTRREETIFIDDIPHHILSNEVGKDPYSTQHSQKSANYSIWLCTDNKTDRKLTEEVEIAIQPILYHIKSNIVHVLVTDLPSKIIQSICGSKTNKGELPKKQLTKIAKMREELMKIEPQPKLVLIYSKIEGEISLLQQSSFGRLS